MRKLFAGTLVLALFAVAFAGPPIDYQLTCGEGEEAILIGVLSLTEGTVHVALAKDASCDGDVVAEGPDGAIEVVVIIDWETETEPLSFTVTIGDELVAAEDVDLVVVPQVAVDGMENAQRLRAAAMERRAEAEARREAAGEGHAGDVEHGESGDRGPAGPPEGVPPVEDDRSEPPVDMPPVDAPPAVVPPVGVPPVETPRGRP